MPVSLEQCPVRRAGSEDDARVAGGEMPACQICLGPIPGGHDHILDTERCAVLCACPACSQVFVRSRKGR